MAKMADATLLGNHRYFNPKGALADAILQLQYGYRPLMSDCYNAVKVLNEQENRANQYVVSRSAKRREGIFFEKDVGVDVAGVTWRVRKRVRGYHKCHVRLDYVKSNAPLVAFSSLGLTNPALLAWELMRLSFVVDWFIPIGSYLNVLDASLGWTFKGGSMTRVTKIRGYPLGSARYWYEDQYPEEVVGTLSTSGNAHQVSFTREVFDQSPLPALPRFKPEKNAEHVMNGVALLNGAISRLLGRAR
jgi:hypothetical protein